MILGTWTLVILVARAIVVHVPGWATYDACMEAGYAYQSQEYPPPMFYCEESER